jgi:hypothetical protein
MNKNTQKHFKNYCDHYFYNVNANSYLVSFDKFEYLPTYFMGKFMKISITIFSKFSDVKKILIISLKKSTGLRG